MLHNSAAPQLSNAEDSVKGAVVQKRRQVVYGDSGVVSVINQHTSNDNSLYLFRSFPYEVQCVFKI